MEWRDVVGYEGLYEVSSTGLVRSVPGHHKHGKELKGKIDRYGYRVVTVSKVLGLHDVYIQTRTVHRMVAEAFIENPDKLPEVDHINGDRQDNRVENLRWVTSKENKANPITKQRQKAAQVRRSATENGKGIMERRVEAARMAHMKPVFCITNNTFYASGVAAAAATGVHQAVVSRQCVMRSKGIVARHIVTVNPLQFRFCTQEEIESFNNSGDK